LTCAFGSGRIAAREKHAQMIPGELLAERYEIVREMGRSAVGATYLAMDTHTRHAVVARLLHVGLVADWKSVELFEREAGVLKALHHPKIPAYVDSFRADVGGEPRFALVREYIEGRDLQEMVDSGWRGTEEQIRGIGRQLADIVAYLHSLRPPVIHRDINPRNIVARDDGEVFLVDFGGVQDTIRLSSRAAATMIGTPGYAPMEQFVGRATVRSDLYGLAATLVFLLTRRSPADLPTKALKLDLESVIEIASPGLARVLSNWLEPDEAARTLSVVGAAALLAQGPEAAAEAPGPAPAASPASGGDRPPYGSRIVYASRGTGGSFAVPIGGTPGRRRSGSFGIVWLVFVAFWTYSAVRMRAPLSFLYIAIPFLAVGVGILRRTLFTFFGKLELEIDTAGVSYSRRFMFASRRRTVPLEDVGECRMEGGLFLDIGARTLRLGQGLSFRELEWLRDSINGCLQRARGLPSANPPRT
jgi:serine/threonine protein kinase